MAFDSAGTFSRYGGATIWAGDAASGTKILAVRHDSHDQEIANGLSECLTRSGKGTPTTDIPWGGNKITNLGTPISPGDAANKSYVDGITGWTTSKNISGSDANGRLNFTSLTGVNGIGWNGADLFWGCRLEVASQSAKRIVLNDKADATGTDVFTIDETGRVNSIGVYAQNLNREGSNWRTPTAGTGTVWAVVTGTISALVNDVATTVAHQVATMRQFFAVIGTGGDTFLTLDKSASGKLTSIFTSMAGKYRWRIDMGNATAESGTDRVGSDFAIHSYNNLGTVLYNEMFINRQTHAVSFGGAVTTSGVLTSGNHTVNGTLSATGNVYAIGTLQADSGNMSIGPGGGGRIVAFHPSYYWNFFTASGSLAYQTPSGQSILFDVSAGTFLSIGNGNLTIAGATATKPGGGSWVAPSDLRLKTVHGSYDHGLCELLRINPKRYAYKTAPDVEYVGLVAQDIEDFLPEMVKLVEGDIDGQKVTDLRQFDPSALTYALINAVKELAAKVEALEAK